LTITNKRICELTDRLAPFAIQFAVGLKALFPDNNDVYIVDDRLIVSSEVLFPSSSDKIETGGIATLDKAANFIKTFPTAIPSDIPWIVQIDGHTDVRPIHTKRFPSNWELSTARAVAVVKYLHDKWQIANERLAAAGYAEFHPLAVGKDPETLHRNRRIEIQLTGHGAWIAGMSGNGNGCGTD
jgi:chemotaxis protein MotB